MDANDPVAIKANLLDAMRAGHEAWGALVDRVGNERMEVPGVEGDWSVKDLIAHIATYEDWMAQQLEAGGPNIPHVVDTMTQDETNEWVFEHNRSLPLSEVRAMARKSFERLVSAVEALSPEDLVSTEKFEWAGGKPASTFIPGESYNHYNHHMPSIESWLAGQTQQDN